MDAGRLIVDPPAPGSWNMAVDQALLHSAARSRRCVLRFYSWIEPTVSIGYFQRAADRQEHRPSRHCPLVRRASGGGAIVHDRELTYSFCKPISDRWSDDLAALCRGFHETLIDVLRSWGVPARLNERAAATPEGREPFLCFQRRVRGDVLLGDWKVAGSAQRRQRRAVLQHGSVLLAASARAPQLRGINDLSATTIDPIDLARRWTSRLTQRFGLALCQSGLDQQERLEAERLVREKFSSDRWTHRR